MLRLRKVCPRVGRSSAGGKAAPTSAPSQAALPADQLDLSPEAQALSETQATRTSTSSDGVRWEMAFALRQAIAEVNYDTSVKRMSGAMDNFLET